MASFLFILMNILSSNALISDFLSTSNTFGTSLFRMCAAGVYDNKLIVWGGYADSGVNNQRYEFDLSQITKQTPNIGLLSYNTFSQACPQTRTNCGSYGLFPGAVGREQFSNKLYMASVGLVNNEMTVYDLSTRSYLSKSSYAYAGPEKLTDRCAVASSFNNKLYLFGYYGSVSTDDPSTMYIYDIATDAWSLGSNMLTPLWQTGCATNLNGQKIYTFSGGLAGSNGGYSDLIQEYDILTDVWIQLTSPKVITPRYGFQCVTNPFKDEIICMGGVSSGSNPLTAEVFEITAMNIYQINMVSNPGSTAEAVWIGPTNDFGYIFSINQNGIQYTRVDAGNYVQTTAGPDPTTTTATNDATTSARQTTATPTDVTTTTTGCTGSGTAPLLTDFRLTGNSLGQYLFRSAAAGICDNKLIVWGGYNNAQQANNDRYEFDLTGLSKDTDSIGTLSYNTFSQPCPETRTNCGSYGMFATTVGREQFDNKLYLASIGLVTNEMTVYDLSTRAYLSKSSYGYAGPDKLNDHCAAASSVNNKLYLFGYYGSDYTDDPSTMYIYDIITQLWSLGSNMPTPLWQTGCATNLDQQNIYTFSGGLAGSNNGYSDLIQKYDIQTDTWTQLGSPKIITPRYGFQCVTNPFKDEIICMGGYNGGSPLTTEVFQITTMNIYQINMVSNGIAEAVWVSPNNDFGYIFAVTWGGIQYTRIEPDCEPFTTTGTEAATTATDATTTVPDETSTTESKTTTTQGDEDICDPENSNSNCNGRPRECHRDYKRNSIYNQLTNIERDDWCAWCLCDKRFTNNDGNPIDKCMYHALTKIGVSNWKKEIIDQILKDWFLKLCSFDQVDGCTFDDVELKETVTGCNCDAFTCNGIDGIFGTGNVNKRGYSIVVLLLAFLLHVIV